MNVVNVLFYKCNLPPEAFKELLAKTLNLWPGMSLFSFGKKQNSEYICACVRIGINTDAGRDRDGDRYNVIVVSVFPTDARGGSSFSGAAIRCLWDSYRWEIRRTPWTTLLAGLGRGKKSERTGWRNMWMSQGLGCLCWRVRVPRNQAPVLKNPRGLERLLSQDCFVCLFYFLSLGFLFNHKW